MNVLKLHKSPCRKPGQVLSEFWSVTETQGLKSPARPFCAQGLENRGACYLDGISCSVYLFAYDEITCLSSKDMPLTLVAGRTGHTLRERIFRRDANRCEDSVKPNNLKKY